MYIVFFLLLLLLDSHFFPFQSQDLGLCIAAISCHPVSSKFRLISPISIRSLYIVHWNHSIRDRPTLGVLGIIEEKNGLQIVKKYIWD